MIFNGLSAVVNHGAFTAGQPAAASASFPIFFRIHNFQHAASVAPLAKSFQPAQPATWSSCRQFF
jgi:hypothetical protein